MYKVLHNPRIVITQLPLTLDYCCFFEADDDYFSLAPFFTSQSYEAVKIYADTVFPFIPCIDRPLAPTPKERAVVL